MEEKCPHIVKLPSGEDESMDGCEVNEERMCVLETGEQCNTYEAIKREWKEENDKLLAEAIESTDWKGELKPKTKMESYEYPAGLGNVLIAKVYSILDKGRYNVEKIEFIVPGVDVPLTVPGGRLESFKEFVVKIYEMLEEDKCLERYSK